MKRYVAKRGSPLKREGGGESILSGQKPAKSFDIAIFLSRDAHNHMIKGLRGFL